MVGGRCSLWGSLTFTVDSQQLEYGSGAIYGGYSSSLGFGVGSVSFQFPDEYKPFEPRDFRAPLTGNRAIAGRYCAIATNLMVPNRPYWVALAPLPEALMAYMLSVQLGVC